MFVNNEVLLVTGILLSLFLAALDQTIITTSLPQMVAQLEGDKYYTWIATSYLLASTITIPIFGRLCDIISSRKMHMISVMIFVISSLLCGISQNFYELTLFRFFQGMVVGEFCL